jgi:C4-dicarboxylate transporter
MGFKLNLILSVGVSLPIFIASMVVAFLTKEISLIAVFTILTALSIVINVYFTKFINDKKEFNPKLFKVELTEKDGASEMWPLILTIVITVLTVTTLAIPGVSSSYLSELIVLLLISIFSILYLTIFQRERLIYQMVAVRIKFPFLFKAKTSDGAQILIISRVKVQSNIQFKAYFIIDDFFLYGYRTYSN